MKIKCVLLWFIYVLRSSTIFIIKSDDLRIFSFFKTFNSVLAHFSGCALTIVPVQGQQQTVEVFLFTLMSPKARRA